MEVIESQFEIQLSDGDGVIIPATVDCETKHWSEGGLSQRACRIILRFDESEIQASDGDFLDAFCGVRKQLEAVGLTPLCYGASRNVYPSGMCRDMGDGLKAYRKRIGEKGSGDDLVSIFDTGPDIEPVSVEAQEEFYYRWLRSINFPVPGARVARLKEFLNRWR